MLESKLALIPVVEVLALILDTTSSKLPSEIVALIVEVPKPPDKLKDQFWGSLGIIFVITSKTLFRPDPVSIVSKAVPPSILVATFIDSEI